MSEQDDGGMPPGGDTAEMLEARDSEVLATLEPKMRAAMKLREEGKDAAAETLLRAILRGEPRLAEPRLELAHILAVRGAWADAQEQARMAVDILRNGGQWTDDVGPNALLSFALNLQGEVQVRELEEGDLFLVDKEEFTQLWNGASVLFTEACELDGDNEDARRNRTRYRALEG